MRLLALVLLAGCERPEPIAWVEGAGYGWTGFNHRLAHLGFQIEGDEAVVAVVGGTSTTDVDPVLPQECDPDTCVELPFTDTSQVDLRWVRVQASKERVGTGAVDLVADVDGETTTALVSLNRKAQGEVFAVIGGFVIDTDHALSGGASCYDPQYGWHPRRIAVELGEPSLSDDGRVVEVDVTASFEAGLSLEDERACIDAVASQALVPIRVEIVALAGDLDLDSAEIEQGATYTWGCEGVSGPCIEPDPQPLPDPVALDLDLESAAAGWSAFDFRFHPNDAEDRGAYLRTLSFAIDGSAGEAAGTATNYSPVSQLSGFEYAFTGTIRSVALEEAPERGRVQEEIPAEVDAEGDPSPQRLPL